VTAVPTLARSEGFAIEARGDAALCVRLASEPSEAATARVMAALAALDAPDALGDRPAGVLDALPGYTSLLVVFEPSRGAAREIRTWIARRLAAAPPTLARPRATVELPALYDPAVAPDLEALAAEKGLALDELVALHSGGDYRCAILGFRPGFPYLEGLDPRLAAARLATPRTRVPAGSVGIGGGQTGVYPGEGPGGWRIVGRTPLRLFDPARREPFLVHPGDRVRFVPIDRAAFVTLGGSLA
jgi:KipI family sensor histidine kinase inhibitor